MIKITQSMILMLIIFKIVTKIMFNSDTTKLIYENGIFVHVNTFFAITNNNTDTNADTNADADADADADDADDADADDDTDNSVNVDCLLFNNNQPNLLYNIKSVQQHNLLYDVKAVQQHDTLYSVKVVQQHDLVYDNNNVVYKHRNIGGNDRDCVNNNDYDHVNNKDNTNSIQAIVATILKIRMNCIFYIHINNNDGGMIVIV